MKLYYSPGACSLAPHIALAELGLPYDAVKVDLKNKTSDEGDFNAVNPRGYVPALKLDNGEVLTEAQVILRYLADQKPEAGMIPKAGTMERVRLEEVLNIISTELHKGMSPLFGADRMVANAEGREQMKAAFKERVNSRYAFMNENLKSDYLMGSNFTVADCYFYTVTRWTQFLGIDMAQFPNVQKYMGRVTARPKVQAALQKEGLKF